MSRTTQRQGGTGSYKEGNLKRPLQEVNAFNLGPGAGAGTTGLKTARLNLQGITPNLSVLITVGLAGQGNRDMPSYPALPGTCKVIPYTMTTNGQVIYQKPLTIAPQVLPASYALAPGMRIGDDGAHTNLGSNMCDGCLIEIEVSADEYANTGVVGNIICAVTAHYTGPWWDIDAIQNMLGYLNISNADPVFIQTGGL